MKWFWKWRLNVYQKRLFMLRFWNEDMNQPYELAFLHKTIANLRKKIGS